MPLIRTFRREAVPAGGDVSSCINRNFLLSEVKDWVGAKESVIHGNESACIVARIETVIHSSDCHVWYYSLMINERIAVCVRPLDNLAVLDLARTAFAA